MKKIKVGLIGCGAISRWSRIPAYTEELQNAEVIATCDIIPERAESAAKALGAKHTFTDYRDLLALKEVDMIDICGPNILHSEAAIAGLNAGKHVFTEKPDAISVSEVLKMQAAAEKSGKHLMSMRNNRYVAASVFLKDYINQGNCGELYAGRCGWLRRRGIPGFGGIFTQKAISGGGPLIDLGVHMIDLAIWFMGNPRPVAVSGSTFTKFADNYGASDSEHAQFGDANDSGIFDVEDLCMGFIKFDNGACLQLEFSWASNIEEEVGFVEMRGTKAGFKWGNKPGTGTVDLYTEDAVVHKPMLTPLPMAHTCNLAHFIDDVIIGGMKPNFVPQDGVDMIKILEGLYKSAETGREVVL